MITSLTTSSSPKVIDSPLFGPFLAVSEVESTKQKLSEKVLGNMTSTKGTILGGFSLHESFSCVYLKRSFLTSVTGANGGLGSAIVKHIAASAELAGYYGLYAVRSASSELSAALASAKAGHTHEVLTLDLTSQSSIRRIAAAINARVAAGEIPPIRALVLNAGFQDFGKQQWLKEADGALDVTFAANYSGHWLLTLLLLQSMDKQMGRVVVVGSQAHECVYLCFPATPPSHEALEVSACADSHGQPAGQT